MNTCRCQKALSYRQKFFAAVRRDDEPLLRYYVALSLSEPDISLLFVIREHVTEGLTALQIAASNGYLAWRIRCSAWLFWLLLMYFLRFGGAAEILIDQALLLGSPEPIDTVDENGMYAVVPVSWYNAGDSLLWYHRRSPLMMAAKNGHLDGKKCLSNWARQRFDPHWYEVRSRYFCDKSTSRHHLSLYQRTLWRLNSLSSPAILNIWWL